DRAGIGGNERVLRRVEKLMQGNADGEDQGEHLKAVEGPAEGRGEQRLPLRLGERAIPRQKRNRTQRAHVPSQERMFRRSGYRFADKNMRQSIIAPRATCTKLTLISRASGRQLARMWTAVARPGHDTRNRGNK